MMNKITSSLLDGVSFEDIMSEKAIEPDSSNRGNRASEIADTSHGNASLSDSTVKFRIIKTYGKLSNRKNAATFALVDWHGRIRYDLRSWSEDYTTPYKGIALSEDEIPGLVTALTRYKKSLQHEVMYTYSAGKANAKIYHSLCTLSSSTVRGITWNKQVNIVDWGRGQKYDFRKWTADYNKCSKGISLNQEEIEALYSILITL